ncbi:MAG TPA: AAA family ATPase [Polyangium sp.]|nr:AAA family ATPase [Polyangium sp.]
MMRTIAFYSYKGGVGRSLTVANVAMYLARLGKNVFVVDLDLEAPGLHYKFFTKQREPVVPRHGMLDILHDFKHQGQPPESLDPYVFDVGPDVDSAGKVFLLPAGMAPSPAYWKKLAQLDWHQMFYSEEPPGVPMFLELKALIEETYNPDFLLLDARTGITDMGGIAISVLADQVVFLMLPTPEHLDGTRAVMRSVQKQSHTIEGLSPVNIVAVLSRMVQRKGDEEAAELQRIRAFLNQEANDLVATLEIDEVFPLHREPELEEREFILVGSGKGIDESLLLADYIRLFARFISPKEFETVDKTIKQLFAQAAEDPDKAEEAMEELSRRFAHPGAYRALIQMYKLRRSPVAKVLSAARTLWIMTKDATDPLVWDVIKKYDHKEAFDASDELSPEDYVGFLDAVWSAHDCMDSAVAEKLVDLCLRIDKSAKAEQILERLLAATITPSQTAVVKLIGLLEKHGRFERALEVVARFKHSMLSAASFVEAWANVVLMEANFDHLTALVTDPQFPWAMLAKKNLALAGRLRFFQGDRDSADSYFEKLMASPNWRTMGQKVLIQGGQLARELDRSKEFEARLKKVFPQSFNTVLEGVLEVPDLPEPPPYSKFNDEGNDEIPTL